MMTTLRGPLILVHFKEKPVKIISSKCYEIWTNSFEIIMTIVINVCENAILRKITLMEQTNDNC